MNDVRAVDCVDSAHPLVEVSVPAAAEVVERRREHRRAVQSKAGVTALDGPLAGQAFEVVTRDLSLSGACFFTSEALGVGQGCRVELPTPGGVSSHACAVVWSREVSSGRFETAVEFRGRE
jgi:hypothetical protein